ncbi:MAG: hydantoinase B/oxoprolinase family protein [Deltaproteobacteria bacterium]|nr:hydantoinase B/oxoprolinase family protein [Deltaproteobacteria bacterium]
MKQLDPILVSVIANRFDAICREIGETMYRTSRSPIFSEARDFVTAVYDRKGRMIAQKPYIAVLAGAVPYAMRKIIEYFGDDLHPGDVILNNDPYLGGNNHQPDFTVAKPVFRDGVLSFWTIAKGHHADTGGGTGCCGYNPNATSIWEEGLRIPPVKIYEKGEYKKSIWDLILANVRMQFLVEGDLRCQVGAATVGERKLVELVGKYGIDTIEAAVDEILDGTERQMRQEISDIPDGVYESVRYYDHDGINRDKKVTIKLAIRIKGSDITFDYTGSDPQTMGGVSNTEANTFSSTCLALFNTVDPDIRKNDGALRPIKLIAPPGSVVNCSEPAPCTSCTICGTATIVEAVWLALSKAVPHLTQAGWARWSSPATMGFNPRTGRMFGDIHFLCKGGAGGTLGYDGWDHLGVISCSGGLRAPDPELHELVDPYYLTSYEFLQDSAGPGKWRGGMGVKYFFRVEADNILSDNFGDGLLPDTAPFGLAGGKGAKPNKLVVRRTDGTVEDPEVHKFVTLNTGDVYEVWETGGGGYGDPFERPIEKVQDDVLDELISIDSAKNDYGVVIDPKTLTVNAKETEKLRKAHQKQ